LLINVSENRRDNLETLEAFGTQTTGRIQAKQKTPQRKLKKMSNTNPT